MIGRIAWIGRVEFVSVARLRWIQLFAVAVALMGMGAAWSAGAAVELRGSDGFARTTVALVPMLLLLVPLVSMLVGVSGQAAEDGADGFLFAQPVRRFEVVLGRWLGESLAVGSALAAGLSAAAAVVALNAGVADAPRFLILAAGVCGLAVVFLAIAALVASVVERRTAALAVAAFIWFFFVLLFDAAALAAAVWLTGANRSRLLMLSVFGNPADLARVIVLSYGGTPHVLGAAGESWQRLFGGAGWAGVSACAGLAAWVVGPLAAARFAINRRDV